MARFITRMADLCRQRAAEDRFLRRFSMMPAADAEAEPGGAGWYESSRELEAGLQVRERSGDASLQEWHEARQAYARLATTAAGGATAPSTC
jgi:hypothetical protein